MSGIRGRDTKPEIAVRRYLHGRGLRYRVAPRDLIGRPDIILPKYRTVVFVHGCFWHRHPGCRFATTPSTNARFWLGKFEANVARDSVVQGALRNAGWRVLVIWECEIEPGTLNNLYCRIREGVEESA